MRKPLPLIVAFLLCMPVMTSLAANNDADHDKGEDHKQKQEEPFKPLEQTTESSVKVAGDRIEYEVHAGTLIIHPKGWSDVPSNNEDADKKAGY